MTRPSAATDTGRGCGFVKMMRSPDALELLERLPLAYALASVIALRTRFMPGQSLKGLNPGECFLGDHEKYGMSRAQYRYALKQLKKWEFVATRTTNRGTIAWLTDTRLFDVLNVERIGSRSQQRSHPRSQQVASGVATNIEGEEGENGQTEELREEETAACAASSASSKDFKGPDSVREVLAHALRGWTPPDEIREWIAKVDLLRSAGEILDDLAFHEPIEFYDVVERAFAFCRYNNRQGWALEHSWRSAWDGFDQACEETGTEIARTWVPAIDKGVDDERLALTDDFDEVFG